jgi:hypothetical protein
VQVGGKFTRGDWEAHRGRPGSLQGTTKTFTGDDWEVCSWCRCGCRKQSWVTCWRVQCRWVGSSQGLTKKFAAGVTVNTGSRAG